MMLRRQSGEYRCEASNGYADNAVTSQAVPITVQREWIYLELATNLPEDFTTIWLKLLAST